VLTFVSEERSVNDTDSQRIYSFQVRDLQAITFRTDIDVSLYFGGGSSGVYPLRAYETLELSHLDFRADRKDVQEAIVEINGICTNAAESGTVHVFGFMG